MELLWFTITNLLLPLIAWSAVFVLVTIVMSLVVARWVKRKMRAASLLRPLPSSVIWMRRVWNVVVLYILAPGIALFHAVPFAASRGLAHILEQSGPDTARWLTQWIVDNAAALGLPPETTRRLVDAGSSAVLTDFATSLHLAAYGQLLSAVVLVLACYALTVLLVLGYAAFLARDANGPPLSGIQPS